MMPHLLGKVLGPDLVAVLEDARALDDVLELADVARPVVVRRGAPSPPSRSSCASPLRSEAMLQEVVDEERDVVPPVAERRYDESG